MKKLILALLTSLTIVSGSNVFSQSTISGKVFSKKDPLPGASITLKDTYDGATADSSGLFKFST